MCYPVHCLLLFIQVFANVSLKISRGYVCTSSVNEEYTFVPDSYMRNYFFGGMACSSKILPINHLFTEIAYAIRI